MLKFIGRAGVERYVEKVVGDDGKEESVTKEREAQQFRNGVMVIRESRTIAGGKIEARAASFTPADIGTLYAFWDDAEILRRYPASFVKP